MKHLIRTSSHGNHVSVIDDLTNNLIVKTSCVPDGVEALRREKEGLVWYSSRLNVQESNLVSYTYETDTYRRLSIQKFSDSQVSYKRAFLKNAAALEQVIEHYIEIWPKEEKVPIHGDLTMDNIVFTGQGVRFFDWEHFSAAPHLWGFDMLYCLLSALLLPLEPDELPTKKDYTKFIELLFVLFDHGLSAELAEYPLMNYRKIFHEEKHWSDIVKNSPHKLFPLQYDELYADIVDDQITRRIRHMRYALWKKER